MSQHYHYRDITTCFQSPKGQSLHPHRLCVCSYTGSEETSVSTYYIHISAPTYPLKTVRKTCILIWCQQLKTLSVQNGNEKSAHYSPRVTVSRYDPRFRPRPEQRGLVDATYATVALTPLRTLASPNQHVATFQKSNLSNTANKWLNKTNVTVKHTLTIASFAQASGDDVTPDRSMSAMATASHDASR